MENEPLTASTKYYIPSRSKLLSTFHGSHHSQFMTCTSQFFSSSYNNHFFPLPRPPNSHVIFLTLTFGGTKKISQPWLGYLYLSSPPLA